MLPYLQATIAGNRKVVLLLLLIFFIANNAAYSQSAVKYCFYGEASFYANKFHGRQTASGEVFSQTKMTCACNALPFGTWLKITNLKNNKWVNVRVNDRLHPRVRRIADLSRLAAKKLGYIGQGLARVKVEVLGKSKPSS